MSMLKFKKEAGLEESQFGKTQKLHSFFDTCIGNSRHSANALEKQFEDQNLKSMKNEKLTNQQKIDVNNVFYETLGINICKDGPAMIPPVQRHEIGKLFGTET